MIPSGKHTKNDGQSQFFMGKLTISMVIFNSYVKLPEGTRIVFGFSRQFFGSRNHKEWGGFNQQFDNGI